MNVTVTDNQMNTITYGYSPEHYGSLVEYYSSLVQSGEIYTYTVKMQRVGGNRQSQKNKKGELMKLVATYPTWRKPVSETYIVDAEEADYWVERLIASGAITVQTRDQCVGGRC